VLRAPTQLRSVPIRRIPSKVRALACVAIFGALVTGAVSLSGAASHAIAAPAVKPSPKKPPPGPLLQGAGIIRWPSLYPKGTGYERYSYVIVGRDDARAAGRLPGISLVYMSGTSVQVSWSTGVSYQEALVRGWLLKDASGAYVKNIHYGAYIGDIGDVAYQQRFVSNVAAFLRATKTKGVFIDDVLGHPGLLTGGGFPAKYPTAEAWENAMVSFVAAVGPELKTRGYYVVTNALKFVSQDVRSETGELTAEFWKRIAPYVNGLMSESWLQNPNDAKQLRAVGTRWYENWSGWQNLAGVAQGSGRDFFGVMYGSADDLRTMRFGRANFLLDWNGRGGAFIYFVTDRDEPYHRAWVTQYGLPLRAKFERAPGVWQRKYARGIVVVNATNAAVRVRVHGALHSIAPTDALLSPNPRG